MKKLDVFLNRIKEYMKKPLVMTRDKPQMRPAGFQPPPPSVSQNKKDDGQSTSGLSSGSTSETSDQELLRTKQVSIGLGICGGLTAIGCFLPWATVLGGFLSISGTDTSDGAVVLILGVLILVAGIYVHPNFSPKRSAYAFALICSALSFLISLVDMINIGSLTAETSLASVGGGLYLCVIGSAGALFLSVIGTFKLKIDGKGSSSQISKTSPPTTFPFAPPKPPPPTDEQVAEMIEQIREDRSSEDS